MAIKIGILPSPVHLSLGPEKVPDIGFAVPVSIHLLLIQFPPKIKGPHLHLPVEVPVLLLSVDLALDIEGPDIDLAIVVCVDLLAGDLSLVVVVEDRLRLARRGRGQGDHHQEYREGKYPSSRPHA